MRGQSSVEFLTTYSWAILLLGIFVGVVALMFLSSSNGLTTFAPSSCYVTPSLPCSQAVVSGNSMGSTFIVILQNNQGVTISFPANAIQVKPSTYTSNTYSGVCLPQIAPAGSTFICSVPLTNFNPAVGSQLGPSFTLKYQLCSPSCTAQVYNTSGTAITSMTPFRIVLSTVNMLANPSSGAISLSETRYASGANVFVLTGKSYPISSLPPAGYGFNSWIATANLVIGNTLSSSTTLTATGPGSLTANFVLVSTSTSSTSTSSTSTTSTIYPVVGLSVPSNSVADVGQYEAFTATVTNGASPFTYNYFVVNSITLGTVVHSVSYPGIAPSSNTYVFQVVGADTSNDPEMVNVVVADATPNTYHSAYSSTFMANLAPATPTLSPSVTVLNVGQTEIYTASWSGGSTPYTVNYIYTNNGVVAQSYTAVASTSNTYTFSPAVAGTYTYNVMVLDSASTPVTVNSITNTIVVNPALTTPTLLPSATSLDVGQTEIYTASWTAGTSPYTVNYIYTNNGVVAQSYTAVASTSNTYTFAPAVAATYTYNVVVSDSASSVTTKGSVTNTIILNLALLAGSVSPASPSIFRGGSSTLTANPSGGTAPYTYIWYSNAGCTTAVGAITQAYAASPTTTTTYCVKVTDSATTPTSVTATDVVGLSIMLKQQTSNSIAAVNTLAFGSAVTAGDKLVVVVSYTPTSSTALPTVSDSQGAAWNQRTSKNTGASSKYAYSEIYDANALSSAADTVKVSATTLNGMIAIYELTPVGSASGITAATAASGSSGTTFNAVSTAFTPNAILISGVANFGGSPTAGTGYTMMKSGGSGSEYSANSISSPGNFLATGSSNYWVDVGVAYQAN